MTDEITQIYDLAYELGESEGWDISLDQEYSDTFVCVINAATERKLKDDSVTVESICLKFRLIQGDMLTQWNKRVNTVRQWLTDHD